MLLQVVAESLSQEDHGKRAEYFLLRGMMPLKDCRIFFFLFVDICFFTGSHSVYLSQFEVVLPINKLKVPL